MGVKNIYERFVWFDNQVRAKKYPNTTTLAEQFEISTKTAQLCWGDENRFAEGEMV